MRMSLNHSGSYICILCPQKPVPRESWWIQVSTQALLKVGKWKGCIWTGKPGKALQFRWGHYRLPPVLTAFLPDDKTEFFLLGLVSILWLLFFFPSCFVWKGVAEQQKGCLCSAWLWQFGSGGLRGGKGGDSKVCMHMERLLTKHMSCLLQRSRSTAKPGRSRRGYIPRDPEGDCEGCCNPGSSASCWAPEHLEGECILKGNGIQGDDLFSKFCLSTSSGRPTFGVF